MQPAGFITLGGLVQPKLRNQSREKDCRCVLQSFSLGCNNSCCLAGAAALSSGRPRQPAATPIYKSMSFNTRTVRCIHTGGVLGVPAASSPQAGRQNTHKKRFTPCFQGASRLSRLKTYLSHVHTSAQLHTHARNRCAQQAGQPGHPRFLKQKQPFTYLNSVVRCPTPQNVQPGHPGHPHLRWSV